MAAKGSIAKKEISKKILEVFPNSFMYNDGKEIRINVTEEGNPIQIKVVLTAAKTAVSNGDDTKLPGEKNEAVQIAPANINEPTDEEKARLSEFLTKMGLN